MLTEGLGIAMQQMHYKKRHIHDIMARTNFCKGAGEENERQMDNNVNCEEMRFVIRNLVMKKILPDNGARNSF